MTTLFPFDLEAAKNGAAIVTRDGRRATFRNCEAAGESAYPFWAYTEDDEEHPKSFTSDGHYLREDDDNENDLFMVEAATAEPETDFVYTPIRGADREFRDKLIHDLAFKMLPEGRTADELMDAVATIMKRRAAIPLA